MERIKVLHVGIDASLGGIETYLLKISSHINREVFQFDFLAYDNQKPCFHDELSSLGCGFHYVRSRRKDYFGNIMDLKELFRRNRYDIVHCHLNSLSYIAPALVALEAGCRVIIHSRNGGTNKDASNAMLGAINSKRLPYGRLTLAAVSDVAGKWMFGNHRFIVLNNGLDTERYRFSEAERRRIRHQLHFSDDVEVLVDVGALRTQKNHMFLLEIFGAYHRVHEDSILLLVGEGELEAQIRDRAREYGILGSVVFAGRRDDIPSVLCACDVFVLPSLYEGFPNALIEAETSGLHCVVSDTITEQACLGNCARVSLNAPVSDWVKAIEDRKAVDRALCPEMVENAGFGIREEISRLENLYRSMKGKTRVLELIGGSLTDGGAETLVKDYVLNIDKSRFDIAVMVDWTFPETANTQILTGNGATIFTVYSGYSILNRALNKFFRRRCFEKRLKSVLRKYDPDVIHVHLYALEYLADMDKLLDGRTLVYTCHSTPKSMLIPHPEEIDGARRLIAGHGLRLIALHGDMAEELNALFNVDDAVVLNNGVDLARFSNVPESKDEIREALGIPKDAFVVGHVGRFSEEKNHAFLLKVFGSLLRRNEKAFLLMVGAGELEEMIKETLSSLGLQGDALILSNRTDIPQILKAMDVFVFPSFFEGLSVVMVEAQASGLRCIVSDSVSHDSFLSDLVVEMSLGQSADAWADAIMETDRIGIHKNRLDEFDIHKSVERLERIYMREI